MPASRPDLFKILTIWSSPSIGGAERIAARIAERLDCKGGVASVNFIPRGGNTETEYLNCYKSCGVFDSNRLIGRSLFWSIKESVPFLYEAAKSSIIHFHSPFHYAVLSRYYPWIAKKAVLHLHCDYSAIDFNWFTKVPPRSMLLCGDFLKRNLIQAKSRGNPIQVQNVEVIRNVPFVSGNVSSELKAKIDGLDLSCLRIAVVGDFSENKNQLLCVEIANGLRRRGISFVFHFFGVARNDDNQVYLENVLKSVADNGLSDYFKFEGFVRSLPARLGDFNLLVSCSKSEGVPLSIMEAQACGLIPIAYACGGVEEIIEDQVSGVLVRRNSAEDFILAIEKLACSKPYFSALLSGAVVCAAEKYGEETYFKSLYDSYSKHCDFPGI